MPRLAELPRAPPFEGSSAMEEDAFCFEPEVPSVRGHSTLVREREEPTTARRVVQLAFTRRPGTGQRRTNPRGTACPYSADMGFISINNNQVP